MSQNNFHPSQIATAAVVFMSLCLVCSTEAQGNGRNFQNEVNFWTTEKCVYPDKSLYVPSAGSGGYIPYLQNCQIAEQKIQTQTARTPEDVFLSQLCQTIYILSEAICKDSKISSSSLNDFSKDTLEQSLNNNDHIDVCVYGSILKAKTLNSSGGIQFDYFVQGCDQHCKNSLEPLCRLIVSALCQYSKFYGFHVCTIQQAKALTTGNVVTSRPTAALSGSIGSSNPASDPSLQHQVTTNGDKTDTHQTKLGGSDMPNTEGGVPPKSAGSAAINTTAVKPPSLDTGSHNNNENNEATASSTTGKPVLGDDGKGNVKTVTPSMVRNVTSRQTSEPQIPLVNPTLDTQAKSGKEQGSTIFAQDGTLSQEKKIVETQSSILTQDKTEVASSDTKDSTTGNAGVQGDHKTNDNEISSPTESLNKTDADKQGINNNYVAQQQDTNNNNVQPLTTSTRPGSSQSDVNKNGNVNPTAGRDNGEGSQPITDIKDSHRPTETPNKTVAPQVGTGNEGSVMNKIVTSINTLPSSSTPASLGQESDFTPSQNEHRLDDNYDLISKDNQLVKQDPRIESKVYPNNQDSHNSPGDFQTIEENVPSSGHFFAYFLTAVVICISGYVIFHNKQKILAFIVEGRHGEGGRRRGNGNVQYSKLKSNVEEVMPSLDEATTAKKFVY